MRMKPRTFDIVALILLCISIGMPLQIMFLYGHAPWEILGIATKLTPLNLAVMGLSFASSVLVYIASPWVMATLPLLTVVVVHNNWFVAEMSTDYSPLMAGLSTGLYLFMIAGLIRAELRELLFNPEKRWWRTPIRFKTEVPLTVSAKQVGTELLFDAITYDLSEGGAFIPAITQGNSVPLSVGSKCFVSMRIEKLGKPITCEAEVVRSTKGMGNYPAGYGIRFINMKEETQIKNKELSSWHDWPGISGLINDLKQPRSRYHI